MDGDHSQCENSNCQNEIQRLKLEISECESKILVAKDAYHQSLEVNLKKDVIIEELKKRLKQQKTTYSQFNGVLFNGLMKQLKC